MLALIEGYFSKLQKLLLWTISAALLLMMCIIFLQVFTRYVIFYSLPWSEELSRYLFVFIIIIGINIAVSQDKLIKIDAILMLVKSVRGRCLLYAFHALLGVITCILISTYATDLFPVGMVQKSPAMRIPMVIMYSIVFIGYVLAAIALAFKFVAHLKGFFDPKNKGVMVSAAEDLQASMTKD